MYLIVFYMVNQSEIIVGMTFKIIIIIKVD